jgi:hypothetical protein
MESSFWCPVADSTFARKTVLSVAVDIDLPVRLGQPHFLLKIDHTFCWCHRVGVTVQNEHLGLYSTRSRWYRRTQNPV